MLVTLLKRQKAFKGIIDGDGKVLRKFKTIKGIEKNTIQCYIDLYST